MLYQNSSALIALLLSLTSSSSFAQSTPTPSLDAIDEALAPIIGLENIKAELGTALRMRSNIPFPKRTDLYVIYGASGLGKFLIASKAAQASGSPTFSFKADEVNRKSKKYLEETIYTQAKKAPNTIFLIDNYDLLSKENQSTLLIAIEKSRILGKGSEEPVSLKKAAFIVSASIGEKQIDQYLTRVENDLHENLELLKEIKNPATFDETPNPEQRELIGFRTSTNPGGQAPIVNPDEAPITVKGFAYPGQNVSNEIAPKVESKTEMKTTPDPIKLKQQMLNQIISMLKMKTLTIDRSNNLFFLIAALEDQHMDARLAHLADQIFPALPPTQAEFERLILASIPPALEEFAHEIDLDILSTEPFKKKIAHALAEDWTPVTTFTQAIKMAENFVENIQSQVLFFINDRIQNNKPITRLVLDLDKKGTLTLNDCNDVLH